MGTGRDLLVLHVRDSRPHAPRFQRSLDDLNDAAMRAFANAGWQPTLLPTADADAAEVLARARSADAVVVMGGEDVDPTLYGGATTYPGSGMHEPHSDRVLIDVIRQSVADRTPLLGICRGNQLLNVALGGTLIPHLEAHRIPEDDDAFVHTVVAVADGADPAFAVGEAARCSHHQAIGALGEGLRVIATAPDGIIEAVVHEAAPVVGVQWHPEHPEVAELQLPALLAATVAIGAAVD